MTHNPMRIGLAGLGTVGSGLASILDMNREWTKRRIGRNISIKTVLEKRLELKGADLVPPEVVFTDNMAELVNDPEIEVVVELIGGTTIARKLITASLEAGKHVVTANKALLAEHGVELFDLAQKKGLHLCYEASVAGGIPIVQTIKGPLAGNRMESILGILNGTANFILTEMTTTGMAFGQALKLATEKGFAEADPSLDVDGHDTAHKLVLLILLAFGRHYPLDKLPVQGIRGVEPLDIEYAREFGLHLKLVAEARQMNGTVEAGVFPALVPESNPLAAVEGSFNAVRLDGDAGPIMLHGYGAGALPTAGAVLADLMTVARGYTPDNIGFTEAILPQAGILPPDKAVYPHYFRFTVSDQPGVLASIAGAMGKHQVSIAQMVQKGRDEGQGVPIVFISHDASAGNIKAALGEIKTLDVLTANPVHYRIL